MTCIKGSRDGIREHQFQKNLSIVKKMYMVENTTR